MLNQGKPRLWPGLHLELAQVQRWASTRQSPGHGHRFNSATPGRGGGSDRAGAALGFNQAKPWPWVPVLNQGKPRLWPGLHLELAQVQMLVLNQVKRWPWPQLQPSPSPGCRRWCSAGLQPGKALALGADSMGRGPAHTHGSTSNATAQNQVKRLEYWNV